MWIETTIALKFLREGRTQTTLILVGIAVGVSVIVFITALIVGLQENIIGRTLGTQAHIRVQPPDEVNHVLPAPAGTAQLLLEDKRAQRLRSVNNWQEVRDTLDRLPDVKAVSPVISGPAFARRGDTALTFGRWSSVSRTSCQLLIERRRCARLSSSSSCMVPGGDGST